MCNSFNLENSLQYLKRKQLDNDMLEANKSMLEFSELEKMASDLGTKELYEEAKRFKNMALHNRANFISNSQSPGMSLLMMNIFNQFENVGFTQIRPYGIEDNSPMLAYKIQSDDKEIILFNTNLFTYAQLFCKILSMHMVCNITETGFSIDIKSITNKVNENVHSRFCDLFFHYSNSSIPAQHILDEGEMQFAYNLCHVFETFIAAHELSHCNFKLDSFKEKINEEMNYEHFEEIFADITSVVIVFESISEMGEIVVYLGILLALEFNFLCSIFDTLLSETNEGIDENIILQKYRRDLYIHAFLANKGDYVNKFIWNIVGFFELLMTENLGKILNAVTLYKNSKDMDMGAFIQSDFYKSIVKIDYTEQAKRHEEYIINATAKHDMKRGHKTGTIDSLMNKGKILFFSNELERALNSFTAALAISERINSGINLNSVIISFYIAKIHMAQEDLLSSCNSFLKSYEVLNELIEKDTGVQKDDEYSNVFDEAKRIYDIIVISDPKLIKLPCLEEFERALYTIISYYNRQMEIRKKAPLTDETKRRLDELAASAVSEDEGAYNENISLIRLYNSILNDLDSGIDLEKNTLLKNYDEDERELHIQMALVTRKLREDTDSQIVALFFLAKSSFEAKEYDEALGYYSTAYKLLLTHEDYEKIALVYKNTAAVFCAKEDYKSAVDYYKKAVDLASSYSIGIDIVVESYGGIARTLEELDDYENALLYYEKALTASINCENCKNEAIGKLKLDYAFCLIKNGFYNKGLIKLREAYIMIKQDNNYSEIHATLFDILRNEYEKTHDINKFDSWISEGG